MGSLQQDTPSRCTERGLSGQGNLALAGVHQEEMRDARTCGHQQQRRQSEGDPDSESCVALWGSQQRYAAAQVAALLLDEGGKAD